MDIKEYISGLNIVKVEDINYFINSEMLANNIIIEKRHTINEEHEGLTRIAIKHLSDMDAQEMILYWATPLAGIQVYRIINDVFNLYKEHSISAFLAIMREFSETYISTANLSGKLQLDVMSENRKLFSKFQTTGK